MDNICRSPQGCHELEHERLLVKQLQSQGERIFRMWQKEVELADRLAAVLQAAVLRVDGATRKDVVDALSEWQNLRH